MDKQKIAGRMLLATFLLWFAVYTYPSFLSAYVQEDLHASAAMVGLITGSYGFTQMVLRVPLGLWSDLTRRRKPFLVAGAAAAVLAALGLMLCKSQTGALVFRALSGVASSTWVTYSVMYSSCFESADTGKAMSRLSFCQYGAQVTGMVTGSLAAEYLGKGSAFLLAGIAGLVGVGVTLAIADVPPTGERQRVRDFLGVLRDRRLLTGTAIATLFNFISWGTVLGFTVNWAKGVIGLSTAQLGLLSAAYMVPNALCARMSDAIARRFSRRVLITAGFALVSAASLLYGHTATAAQIFAVQVLFGCGLGIVMPMTMADAIANIPDARRGAAMGFYQSVYGLGMFLGPVIAGAVVDAFSCPGDLSPGYQANFILMALVGLAGAVLALKWTGKPKNR